MRVVFLSIAAHAVAFALVLRTPRRERAPEPAPPLAIEIVEEEPPPPERPSDEIAGERASAMARAASTARAPSRGAFVATSEGPPAIPPGSEATPAPVWSGSFFTPSPQAIAIGGANPFVASSSAPSEEERKKKPDLGLRFGPSSEGPALSVLRDVTSRSLAPLEGRARFTVRANADGEVLGIDIDDSTGGPGWDDARRLALDELRHKKLVVPRGARGINVRFEIVSELSYPSGQKEKGAIEITAGGLVLPDESNIGQSRRRKIHTRHLETEVL